MFCQLYLLSHISCNPHAEIVKNRIDVTEYVYLTLALSQCSLTPCDRHALEQIRIAITCENNEIERIYLEANPGAELIELQAIQEGDRFYIPID